MNAIEAHVEGGNFPGIDYTYVFFRLDVFANVCLNHLHVYKIYHNIHIVLVERKN